MHTIQETVRDLKELSPSHLRLVHNLILSLKRTGRSQNEQKEKRYAYRKAQRAFSTYKGSLSDDIIAMREDRI